MNRGKGFSSRKGVVLEIVLLRGKVDMMGKLSQVVLSGIVAALFFPFLSLLFFTFLISVIRDLEIRGGDMTLIF